MHTKLNLKNKNGYLSLIETKLDSLELLVTQIDKENNA